MSRLTPLDSLKYSMPSWEFSTCMASRNQNYTILWIAGYNYHQKETPCLGSINSL